MIILYCKYCRCKIGCIVHESIHYCNACSVEKCRQDVEKEKQYVGWCEECFVIGVC